MVLTKQELFGSVLCPQSDNNAEILSTYTFVSYVNVVYVEALKMSSLGTKLDELCKILWPKHGFYHHLSFLVT